MNKSSVRNILFLSNHCYLFMWKIAGNTNSMCLKYCMFLICGFHSYLLRRLDLSRLRLVFSGNDMVSTLPFGSICVRREWIMPMPNYTVFTAIYNQKEEDSQEVVACLERWHRYIEWVLTRLGIQVDGQRSSSKT